MFGCRTIEGLNLRWLCCFVVAVIVYATPCVCVYMCGYSRGHTHTQLLLLLPQKKIIIIKIYIKENYVYITLVNCFIEQRYSSIHGDNARHARKLSKAKRVFGGPAAMFWIRQWDDDDDDTNVDDRKWQQRSTTTLMTIIYIRRVQRRQSATHNLVQCCCCLNAYTFIYTLRL